MKHKCQNRQRISEDGQITTVLVESGTTSRAPVAFGSWRQAQPCLVVALESTGGYGKPDYHVLRAIGEAVLANSRAVRQWPGTVCPCPLYSCPWHVMPARCGSLYTRVWWQTYLG